MKKVFGKILEFGSLIVLIIASAMFFHTNSKEDAIWLAVMGAYMLGTYGIIKE